MFFVLETIAIVIRLVVPLLEHVIKSLTLRARLILGVYDMQYSDHRNNSANTDIMYHVQPEVSPS
jgi:hypothetical protein